MRHKVGMPCREGFGGERDAVEEPFAGAEGDRGDVQPWVVDQRGGEVLV
jgi:hypothetical protein